MAIDLIFASPFILIKNLENLKNTICLPRQSLQSFQKDQIALIKSNKILKFIKFIVYKINLR